MKRYFTFSNGGEPCEPWVLVECNANGVATSWDPAPVEVQERVRAGHIDAIHQSNGQAFFEIDEDKARKILGVNHDHIVQIPGTKMLAFTEWLRRRSGSYNIGRVTFCAVTDGGLLVRTQPYRYPES